jgi:hypothetical protein
MGITHEDPDLWGFCGGADSVRVAGSPASAHDQRQATVRGTVVTECAELASLAGSETAPNAEYSRLTLRLPQGGA